MTDELFYMESLQRLMNTYNRLAQNCITAYSQGDAVILAEYAQPQLKFSTWQSAYQFFETFALRDLADCTNL